MTRKMQTNDVDEWLDSIADDPTIEAADAADLREIGIALVAIDAADANLRSAVTKAREAGRSWTEVANVLGVSRQAARQRFMTDPATGTGAFLSHAPALNWRSELMQALRASISQASGMSIILAPAHELAAEMSKSGLLDKGHSVDDLEQWVNEVWAAGTYDHSAPMKDEP